MNFIRLGSTTTPSFCTGQKPTDVAHQTLLNRSLFSLLSLRTSRQPKCSAQPFKTMSASWPTESTAKSNFNQFDLWCALVLFATVSSARLTNTNMLTQVAKLTQLKDCTANLQQDSRPAAITHSQTIKLSNIDVYRLNK